MIFRVADGPSAEEVFVTNLLRAQTVIFSSEMGIVTPPKVFTAASHRVWHSHTFHHGSLGFAPLNRLELAPSPGIESPVCYRERATCCHRDHGRNERNQKKLKDRFQAALLAGLSCVRSCRYERRGKGKEYVHSEVRADNFPAVIWHPKQKH